MKTLPSVIRNFMILALIAFLLVSLGWMGIMPVVAVQVLLNTLLIGTVLILVADILINIPMSQRH